MLLKIPIGFDSGRMSFIIGLYSSFDLEMELEVITQSAVIIALENESPIKRKVIFR